MLNDSNYEPLADTTYSIAVVHASSAVPETMTERLERFELIAELATGGMGTVFLARLGGAGGFQRLYAIKRLHEHLARHDEFLEMFLDEARLAARIHHPNVVPILEVGTTAGYYVVMEYIEGDTAGRLLKTGRDVGKIVPIRVSLRIVLDVLAGLHAAHEGSDDEGKPLEIVHRDVSPHNILVGVDGVSRITDFGIARAASRLAITRSGQLKGKLAYMAPEQARSEKVDRRADVFAMGICLWEMLAQRRLFTGEGEGDILNRVLYEPIPAPISVVPTIPSALNAVCVKALARDPEQRFATAAEFSNALEDGARARDLVGTRGEVACCVADVLGNDISERRSMLRAWLGDGERRRSSIPPPALESKGEPKGVLIPLLSSIAPHVSSVREPGTLVAQTKGSLASSRLRQRGAAVGVACVLAAVAASAGAIGWRTLRFDAVSGPAARPAVATVAPAPPIPKAASGREASELAEGQGDPPPSAAVPESAASTRAEPPLPPIRAVTSARRPVSSRQPSEPPVPADILNNPYR